MAKSSVSPYLVLAGLAVGGALAVRAASAARRPQLSADVNGDPELADMVRDAIGPGVRDRLVVAALDSQALRIAGFGADADTEFEIGSITKTMTALLLAEAIDRGEVSADTRLGELLDLGGSEAGNIRLIDLVTHHSGLPNVGGTLPETIVAVWRVIRRRNPYQGMNLASVVRHVRTAVVGSPEFAYSNLGFAILGHALAAAAGTDFTTLLTQRVFIPSGMKTARIPSQQSDVSEDAAGWAESGRQAAPWILEGYAPAGGVRASVNDLVAYARYILSASPLSDRVLSKVGDVDEATAVGYSWLIEPDSTVWHNGGTGGFSSFLVLDPSQARAVIVVSNTAADVDSLGRKISGELWNLARDAV